MAQSQYDAPIAEFFKWSDELHKEINDSPRLLNAFLLIKPDLLKIFLTMRMHGWISQERSVPGSTLCSTQASTFFNRLSPVNMGRQFPTENLRKPPRAGLRGKLRTRLSRVKRTRANKRVLSGGEHNTYTFGPDPLTRQIAPDGTQRLRLLAGDVDRRRQTSAGIPRQGERACTPDRCESDFYVIPV